jgi:hypothetical protein
MQKYPDEILVEFNDGALKLLGFVFAKFEKNVRLLDRNKDDNVFQQLRAKYLHSFKNELENMAKIHIEKYKGDKAHELNNRLSNSIDRFTNEFVQQIRAL